MPAVLHGEVDDACYLVFRCAAIEVVRERRCGVVSEGGGVGVLLPAIAQGAAAFASDCYAGCQAIGVDSESD